MSKLNFRSQITAQKQPEGISDNIQTQDRAKDLSYSISTNPKIAKAQKTSKNFSHDATICQISAPSSRRSLNELRISDKKLEINSSFSKKTQATNITCTPNDHQKAQDLQKFPCPVCNPQQVGFCIACKGKGQIRKDSNIMKFFAFIVDFKMGKQQSSYNPEPTTKQVLQNRESIARKSMRCSLDSVTVDYENIHYGYFCNTCGKEDPIRGPRFNCMICEDYDLCEKCYSERGHRHVMQQIRFSACLRNREAFFDIAKKKSVHESCNGVGRLSLRVTDLENRMGRSSFR